MRCRWERARRREVPPLRPSPQIPARHSGNAKAEAGASLTREYDRLLAKRDERVRARLPRLGPLLLAVFDESQSTKAFKQGAEGERRAVKRLLESSGDDVHFLVNRKLGRCRRDGDIDVIAVSSSGASSYEGCRSSVRRVCPSQFARPTACSTR